MEYSLIRIINGKNDDDTNGATATTESYGSDWNPTTNRPLNDGRIRRYYDGRRRIWRVADVVITRNQLEQKI
mgnify:CR=1 FL=1